MGIRESLCCLHRDLMHGSFTVSAKTVADAMHELQRLQAIVDQLPKCWRLDDFGSLIQDVPMVPGMAVYGIWCDPGVDVSPQLKVTHISQGGVMTFPRLPDSCVGSGLANSHKAAEALRKRNQEQQGSLPFESAAARAAAEA